MAAVIRHLNRRRPLRLALVAPAVILAILASPDGERRAALNRWTVRIALRGISVDEYRTAAVLVAERLAQTPHNFPAAARAVLRTARASGEVWIATASEQSMAEEYLRRIGHGDLPVLASSFHSTSALRIARHNVGRAKVTALKSAGVDLATAQLYTDSASDAELSRACARTIVVNGTRRTRRLIAATAGVFRIEHW